MLEVTAENYKGEKLQLNDSLYFDLVNVTGIDPVVAALNYTDLAGADGAYFNSGRRPKRNIILTLVYKPPIEINRNMIYKYFPTNTNIKLYFKTESKSVYINGRVESNAVPLYVAKEQSVISIICGSPYFKSSEAIDISFSQSIALFQFPFSIPAGGIEFSRIEHTNSIVINAGDVTTGAIFTLTATTSQILNPKIINETTQEYFALNVDMLQGDKITINTNQFEKSVTLNSSGTITNLLNERQSGSKWIHLAAGENTITYTCDEGAANLNINVLTHACYEGL